MNEEPRDERGDRREVEQRYRDQVRNGREDTLEVNIEGLRIPALDERRGSGATNPRSPRTMQSAADAFPRATLRPPRDIRLRRLGRLVRIKRTDRW